MQQKDGGASPPETGESTMVAEGEPARSNSTGLGKEGKTKLTAVQKDVCKAQGQ